MSPIRLNKLLALRLGIARRQADLLIEQGKVTVDGHVAVLGQQVSPEAAILVDSQPIPSSQDLIYILLHKPVGYVCSRRKQGDSDTIYSLLPEKFHHLKPVGRLDRDSSGLILLTNDGDFAHQMTHPKFAKEKMYEVALDRPLALEDLAHVNRGVGLEDGISRLKVRELSSSYQITMHEGRNRQIRRTFAALGYTVVTLHRVQFGAYSFAHYPLKPGQWQSVEPHLLQ